ncbi:MAG: hypothetical protein ACM34K_11155, partial [Bacillota bacterium]
VLPKHIPYIVVILASVFYFALHVHYTIIYIIITTAHMFILYFIFKMATADVINLKVLKVFYIVIILYELSVVLKYVFIIASVHTGDIYFYMTTAFEILLGLFFICVGENNARAAIPLNERISITE